MKKHFLTFAMLASVAASAQVTHIEPVSANYANNTVSFRVWWNAGSRDAAHLSKAWVWVDYITVNSNNTTSGNTWTRATVGTISGGVTSYDGSNRQGFWLEGNASTNYSATLTVQLTNVPAKFNWCAYVSDFPPNVTVANGTYTFKGTPPFTLIAANGTTSQTVTGTTLVASALTITPATIRDKTECPGVFCMYSGSDLYIDATHFCQQRISGAQNWEAWIKDTRDNELYRIVLMPDNKWWLADNIRYTKGNTIGNCSNNDAARCATPCGRWYNPTEILDASAWSTTNPSITRGICPVNWHIPSEAETKAMLISLSETTDIKRLVALKSNNTIAPMWTACGSTGVLAGSDRYGFSMYPCGCDCGGDRWTTDGYMKLADSSGIRLFFVERQPDLWAPLEFEAIAADINGTPVRCRMN